MTVSTSATDPMGRGPGKTMKKKSEEFYLIFETGNPLEAQVIRSALEAGGIPSFMDNEGTQNLFALGSLGGINPLIGTVKIYIRHDDRPEAEKLLADFQTKPDGETEFLPESLPETPKPKNKGFLALLRDWFSS